MRGNIRYSFCTIFEFGISQKRYRSRQKKNEILVNEYNNIRRCPRKTPQKNDKNELWKSFWLATSSDTWKTFKNWRESSATLWRYLMWQILAICWERWQVSRRQRYMVLRPMYMAVCKPITTIFHLCIRKVDKVI